MKIKTFFLVSLLPLFSSLAVASTLKIKIEGLKSSKGSVELTLFKKNAEAHFPIHPEHSIVKEIKTVPIDKNLEFVVPNLTEGEYAAFAYHDEDGNKKLNTNFMHIPTEGYGASKGAMNKFGPPKFKDAQFSMDAVKESAQTIVIAY